MSILAPAITIVNSNPFDPKALVDFMHENFPKEFEKILDVWERYSLKRHISMVLGQYEKYFAAKPLPGGFTDGQFRLFLAVHDLGKPQAEWEGDKKLQLKHNPQRFEEHFPWEPFINEVQRDLLASFLKGDPIGSYLKNNREGQIIPHSAISEFRDVCVSRFEEMFSPRFGLNRSEYLEAFLVYYMCDAGSYTKDAGGYESLDRLFSFKGDSMDFSDDVKKWIDAVRERFV